MEQDILKAIECLKNGVTKKISKNIYAVSNAVVFRDIKESNYPDREKHFKQVEQVIAIKTDSGVILGNSSRMQELEDRRFKHLIQPARIQRLLSEHVTMIPFSVFIEAGLDLLSCEILDSGAPETLKERQDRWSDKLIERHFTGARLFKALTKNRGNGIPYEAKYFLCDVDRRETEHNIINFFLAELPEKCETIEDAYSMLKPNEVKMFEQNTGLQVERQGEFFFIPSVVDPQEIEYLDADAVSLIREIRVGNSRPNRVEKGYQVDDKFYVTGTISHTGREHADLHLDTKRWFKVVPNTSKANFQLTGDID